MMFAGEVDDGAVISSEVWAAAQAEMQAETKDCNDGKKKSKKKPKGQALYHFSYSLQDRKFNSYSVERVSNLFFTYATAMGEDVSMDYFVLQMNDEDEDEFFPQERRAKRNSFSYDVDPLREAVLRRGIRVEFDHNYNARGQSAYFQYHLIGCSNSQIQKHRYIFRRANSLEENESRMLEILPKLTELKVPKRVKYAGLLFSGITSVQLPTDQTLYVKEIASVKRNGYDFTDGPGLISKKLALKVCQQLGIGTKDCPSIFQIRYCGRVRQLKVNSSGLELEDSIGPTGFVCKGVLVVDPTNEETYTIQVRRSMLKIQASSKACDCLWGTLGICSYSQPSPGRLGQQQICLLSGTVEPSDLFRIQQEHLDCLKTAFHDPFAMAWVLSLGRQPQGWKNFHNLLMAQLVGNEQEGRGWDGQTPPPPAYEKCTQMLGKEGTFRKANKVQLPLAASRTLFGAVFPELLDEFVQEGECVVLLENGLLANSGVGENYVIVSRSPSYHPGDIRVLRVVSLPDEHPVRQLRNCILFTTKGPRPDPDKMGGGDLDGDKYLVIWHPLLLKYTSALMTVESADYRPATQTGKGSGSEDSEETDWIRYAAITDNAMLGEVESTFYKLAQKHGVKSSQIFLLNSLFSSLVDRLPTSMEPFQKLKHSVVGETSGGCLWEDMTMRQSECVEALRKISLQHRDCGITNTYRIFHEAASLPSMRQSLVTKITDKFGYHFQASLLWPDVLKTISELQLLSPLDSAKGYYKDDGGDREDFHERPQLSEDEKRVLSSFVKRAYELFAEPLARISRDILPYTEVVEEQAMRKQAWSHVHEKDVESLLSLKSKAEDEIHQANQEHRTWLEKHRYHVAIEVAKEWETGNRFLSHLEAQRKERGPSLDEARVSLDRVDEELRGMWYVLDIWSNTKRDALERKRVTEARLKALESDYNAIVHEIQEQKHSMKIKLEAVKMEADYREEEKNAALKEKLTEIKEQRALIEAKIENSYRNYARLTDGTEQTQIQDEISLKESEINYLCMLLESSEQGDDNCNWQYLKDRMQELLLWLKQLRDRLAAMFFGSVRSAVDDLCTLLESSKQGDGNSNLRYLKNRMRESLLALKQLMERFAAMICPVRLLEAEVKMQEQNDQMESIKLGRGHILHKVTVARRIWVSELESGMIDSRRRREEKWKALVESLERVFTIEKNRLLGFPLNGKRCNPMPVYSKRAELQRHLRASQALIVTAETGCGKSTQIPQYIADDFYSYQGSVDSVDLVKPPARVCCTQPRRLAAQLLAKRVATEYKTSVGDLVGFKVGSRGRAKADCVKISEKNTVIEFVTEGLLLFNLARSREYMERFDAIIIDEMHERNSEQDLCICLLRDYLRAVKTSRPNFKVVIMSATIDAQRFCEYFDCCPKMKCTGIKFPVEENYLPPPAILLEEDKLVDHATNVLFEEVVLDAKEVPGDVLIFLSGASAIDACVRKINERAGKNGDPVVAYPLYARLDDESRAAATNPDHRCGLGNKAKKGVERRKVVCTTNIAETSITIDGVRCVIDGGRSNKLTYDHILRCPALTEGWISHASTVQRKGRAGRTTSGVCFYLYERDFHEKEMARYDTPNILEEPVDRLVLFSMNLCGKSIEEMDLLDTPKAEDISSAKERLMDLGFLEEEKGGCLVLTADGKVACALSPTVRQESCRMMINCCRKYPHLVNKGLALAVLMSSEESIFHKDTVEHKEDDNWSNVRGDHMISLRHFEWFVDANRKTKKGQLTKKCNDRGLNFRVLSSLQEDVERCYRELKQRQLIPSIMNDQSETLNDSSFEFESLGRAMTSGYFHHVVNCLEKGYSTRPECNHVTIKGVSLYLDRGSSLNRVIAPSHSQNTFIDDAAVGGNRSVRGCGDTGSNELTVVEEAVVPYLMLYGNLKKSKANMIFMLDASNIECLWVLEEAPSRWIERVQFDPQRMSRMRSIIKHVGPKVLIECSKISEGCNFFEEIKSNCLVDAVSTNREMRQIVITGTQTCVNKAEYKIAEALTSVRNRFCSTDSTHNRVSCLRLGAGMKAEGRRHKGWPGERQFHEIFTAFGTNDRDYTPYTRAANFVSTRTKDELRITPLHDCTMGMLACAFKNVPKTLRLIVKREKNGFLVKCRGAQGRLERHEAFLFASLEPQFFTKKVERLVVHALGREAYTNSAFWRSFRTEMICGGNKDAVMTFVRSHESFLFGPGNGALATAFKNTVNKMSKTLEMHQIEHPEVFEPYQGRCIAAILAETRKRFPKVLFYACAVKLHGDTIEENTEFQSDFEWLVGLVKLKKVTHIRICFTSLLSKESAQAKGYLRKHLSLAALQAATALDESADNSVSTSYKFGQRQCVMCRRGILVVFGKSDKVCANDLRGWNLTLCGCSYCRECFRHGITETLKDELYKSARCAKCEQIVLSNDCIRIIVGPKDAGAEEWDQLCRLAESNYCKVNEALITRSTRSGLANRRRGWATCPNCDHSMVHPHGYHFFFCRNQRCRKKICTRCYTIPTCSKDMERCARDICSPRDGE